MDVKEVSSSGNKIYEVWKDVLSRVGDKSTVKSNGGLPHSVQKALHHFLYLFEKRKTSSSCQPNEKQMQFKASHE